MEDDEETFIKPNVDEQVESSRKAVQSDDVFVPELVDSFLVEPESAIVGRNDDVVTETVAEVADESAAGVTVKSVVEEVEERGFDTTGVIGRNGEGVEAEFVRVKEEGNVVENETEEEVEVETGREVEAVMRVEEGVDDELESKTEGGEEFASEVEVNEAEVREEVLTVESKMESEIVDRGESELDSMGEPVGDLMPVEAANDETEAMEEGHVGIEATQEVIEDEVKVMEEVVKEVVKDETEAIYEVEKDETEAVEEVEKDETEELEEVEEDESRPMEEVEKDDGEGESTGAEDELEIVGIEKDGEGESITAEDDDEATATGEDVQEVETETPESAKSTGGKRKRGKNLKVSTRARATRKTIEEEDVCFICFDGGDLVLCDRR